VRSPCCLLLTCPAPLNIAVSGVNRHDSMLVEPILDSKPAIKGVSIGHPRRQPIKRQGSLLSSKRLAVHSDCTALTINALAAWAPS
jgi:hypothetical protein